MNTKLQIPIILLMLFIPMVLHAQYIDPGTDPDVPLDGGLFCLIAGGFAYGIKKIKQHQTNQPFK